ncbi:ATP-dependent RNA helicase RhlB [Chitinispirillum alkaliphilum]|nr:ATP-dependent RNA helicase RhlB [Chitinispirillum alkaliphilum]
MPVQKQTLHHALQGRDVLVQSQTGTGKTAAFLVSIFALLRSGKLKHSKAMIIAPTRELAVQIEKEALLLGHNLGLGICSFYGGVGYGRQQSFLSKGVDILIGTPGRILDFKKSKQIDFKEIGIFVIDEADRLFDMGFLGDIIEMLRSLPPCSERQTMLFSATLSREVRKIAREYMHEPTEIEIESERVTVDAITQELLHVSSSEKMNLLLGILKKEAPNNALIFTNMKDQARIVAQRLRHNGYMCEHLSGDLPQGKRSRIVEQVKNGKIRYLVATDVAARGIHIDNLELVINYDIPEHSENYVHRIGRTARAGKSGKAISLACEDYVHGLEPIEKLTNIKIPVNFADSDMYLEDTSAGINFKRNERNRKNNQNRNSSPSRNSNRNSSSSESRQAGAKFNSNRGNYRKQNGSDNSHASKSRNYKSGHKTANRAKNHSHPQANTSKQNSTASVLHKTPAPKKSSWFKRTAMKLLGK